jgi:hypothetical protein
MPMYCVTLMRRSSTPRVCAGSFFACQQAGRHVMLQQLETVTLIEHRSVSRPQRVPFRHPV